MKLNVELGLYLKVDFLWRGRVYKKAHNQDGKRNTWIFPSFSRSSTTCQCLLTVKHILVECTDFNDTRNKYLVTSSLEELFRTVDVYT